MDCRLALVAASASAGAGVEDPSPLVLAAIAAAVAVAVAAAAAGMAVAAAGRASLVRVGPSHCYPVPRGVLLQACVGRAHQAGEGPTGHLLVQQLLPLAHPAAAAVCLQAHPALGPNPRAQVVLAVLAGSWSAAEQAGCRCASRAGSD